jgi:hypothetical protein
MDADLGHVTYLARTPLGAGVYTTVLASSVFLLEVYIALSNSILETKESISRAMCCPWTLEHQQPSTCAGRVSMLSFEMCWTAA